VLGTYAVLGTWCPMWHSVLSALYYSAWPVVVVLVRAWCFTQCSVLPPLTSAGTYAVLGTWCPMWHSVLSALCYSAWPVVVVLGRAWCCAKQAICN
jgi:hypothetical protein